jgi:hypothetical protein
VHNDNSKRLKETGFEIGHAPKMGEPHKTFTFVTKCAFEGVDFYSPCAYTFIFSNINLENLALDISLDLPQIMGRQRRNDNPFRYDATFYYKELMDYGNENQQEFQKRIVDKQNASEVLIDIYNNCNQENARKLLADKYRGSQKRDKYSKDYVAVVDDEVNGTQRVVFNQLAMFNEIRAWDIQKGQYINGCQVMRSINDATFSITEDKELESFLLAFVGAFEDKMKIYCDFLQAHPDDYKAKLEWLPQIPLEIKNYYNAIGPINLRAMSYKEANIKQYLGCVSLQDSIKEAAESMFVKGQFYTLKQVKAMLQQAYDNLGTGMKAKATDLEGLLNCSTFKKTVNGCRENGYVIL